MSGRDDAVGIKLQKREDESELVRRLTDRDYGGRYTTMLDDYRKETGNGYHASALSRALAGRANINQDFMKWVLKKITLRHTNSGVFVSDVEIQDPLISAVERLLEHGYSAEASAVLERIDSAAELMSWDSEITFARIPAMRAMISLKNIASVPHDAVYRFLTDKASCTDIYAIRKACRANLPHLEKACLAFELAKARCELYNHYPMGFRYESCILNLKRDLLNHQYWPGNIKYEKYLAELKQLKNQHEKLLSSSVDSGGLTVYIVHQNMLRLADSLRDKDLFWDIFTWATETRFMGRDEKELRIELFDVIKKDSEFHWAKIWIQNPSISLDDDDIDDNKAA